MDPWVRIPLPPPVQRISLVLDLALELVLENGARAARTSEDEIEIEFEDD